MDAVSGLIPLILVIGIMYFLLIRPQKRRVEEHRKLTESIEPGDRIVTIGGLHGTVRSIGEDELELEVAPNVSLRYAKSAVARRVGESLPSSATSSLASGRRASESSDGTKEGTGVTPVPATKSTTARSTSAKKTAAKKTTGRGSAKKTVAKKTTAKTSAKKTSTRSRRR